MATLVVVLREQSHVRTGIGVQGRLCRSIRCAPPWICHQNRLFFVAKISSRPQNGEIPTGPKCSCTTYHAYWRLHKKVADDPRYLKMKAEYLLKSFVELHPHAIGEKVRICVDHFGTRVQDAITGKAKAMIVTRSRLHAVRYKLAVDKYLAERGYPFKALVAFSGKVEDGAQSYTESGMNGFPEAQTAKAFERPEFRFLIVANKFQTGFDQPLLHTMYVDKKLGGVNAVQTLSRLNRTHPDKKGTMVLDFANGPDEIRAAFEPYFETTLLSEATDPNLLYEIQRRSWVALASK